MCCLFPFLCCFGVQAFKFASRPGSKPAKRKSAVKRRENTRKREQDLYVKGLGVPGVDRGRTAEQQHRE
ncbi:unnamed protein product [Peniophora sp. CBMAI 1063]|nr:unnamed protein product [Peniophora sp. CBMAI 1063]